MLDPLIDIARSLAEAAPSEDRYERIVAAVRGAVRADSVAILALEDGVLVPLATEGLRPDAMLRRYRATEHPRLERILGSWGVVRFRDRHLPDPFDGLLAATPDGHIGDVHACMGAPLVVQGEIIGVLAMDALAPAAFDDISDEVVTALAALASAAVQTARLLEHAQADAASCQELARPIEGEPALRNRRDILGRSAAIRRLRDEVEISAATDLTMLITGETGVGKEVVARAVHAASPRASHPLVYVNCAALPESISESELFGHVRGAFTGANEARAGKFEMADGGTLFLDEIGELPLGVQPKLLRALQEGEIQRVGSDKVHRVNVRVIAATNRNLEEEVRAGRFRADLFHRLSVFPIHVPALRDHREDVLLLAGHFADDAKARLGLGPVKLDASAREALESYDWPGNVRELEHVVLRAALRAAGGRRRAPVSISAAHLALQPCPIDTSRAGGADTVLCASDTTSVPTMRGLREQVAALERRLVADALARAEGNWARAARELRVDRANLHRVARRLGVAPAGTGLATRSGGAHGPVARAR